MIDRSGEKYLGVQGSSRVLGVDVFYDIFGRAVRDAALVAYYPKLITSNNVSIQTLLYSDPSLRITCRASAR
jgi:hypothetical protein